MALVTIKPTEPDPYAVSCPVCRVDPHVYCVVGTSERRRSTPHKTRALRAIERHSRALIQEALEDVPIGSSYAGLERFHSDYLVTSKQAQATATALLGKLHENHDTRWPSPAAAIGIDETLPWQLQ